MTTTAARPARIHLRPPSSRRASARGSERITSSTRSPQRASHTKPGGVARTAHRTPAMGPEPARFARLEREIERPSHRYDDPARDSHPAGPSSPSETEKRSADECAQQERAPHPDEPAGERSPPHSAPDRGCGCLGRSNPADREDVGAARDMPVIRRQHAPGHRVGARWKGRQRHAIAPGIAGIDRGPSAVDALAARVQHLERARTGLDTLGEPDHHLRRRRGQAHVRSGIHRRRTACAPAGLAGRTEPRRTRAATDGRHAARRIPDMRQPSRDGTGSWTAAGGPGAAARCHMCHSLHETQERGRADGAPTNRGTTNFGEEGA